MRTPWHIWVVGLVTLLWNAFGAYNYLMTELRVAAYFEMIPEDRRAAFVAYLDTLPLWYTSLWALGVWGSVAGSLMILGRTRHAVAAFALSLAGFLANNFYAYVIVPGTPISATDQMTLILNAAIFLVLLFEIFYSRRQVLAGNLG